MKELIEEYLPNAPKIGLYVDPNIPASKLENALSDYARSIQSTEVLALYDATLLGSGKDGAVFLADRFVYQNNDLEPPQIVRYDDVVRVNLRKRLLGGRQVVFDINSGSATVTHTLDFSGHPEAADFVARFLQEAMLRAAAPSRGPSTSHRTATGSDVDAIHNALDALREEGKLSGPDFRRLLDALMEGA